MSHTYNSGVIVLVISNQIWNHSHDYSPSFTPLSPVVITTFSEFSRVTSIIFVTIPRQIWKTSKLVTWFTLAKQRWRTWWPDCNVSKVFESSSCCKLHDFLYPVNAWDCVLEWCHSTFSILNIHMAFIMADPDEESHRECFIHEKPLQLFDEKKVVRMCAPMVRYSKWVQYGKERRVLQARFHNSQAYL